MLRSITKFVQLNQYCALVYILASNWFLEIAFIFTFSKNLTTNLTGKKNTKICSLNECCPQVFFLTENRPTHCCRKLPEESRLSLWGRWSRIKHTFCAIFMTKQRAAHENIMKINNHKRPVRLVLKIPLCALPFCGHIRTERGVLFPSFFLFSKHDELPLIAEWVL